MSSDSDWRRRFVSGAPEAEVDRLRKEVSGGHAAASSSDELPAEVRAALSMLAAPPGPDDLDRLRARIAEDLEAPSSAPVRRFGWRVAVVAAAAGLVIGLGLGRAVGRIGGANVGPVALEVPAGATTLVQLADGVTFHVNSASTLAYRVAGRTVEVELDGEAFFSVAEGSRHDLRVITEAGEVRDIGTEFNVLARDGRVRVTVAEGAVELGASGRVVRVEAGEESWAEAGSQPAEPRKADLAMARAWREGIVMIRDEPLGAAAAELERRYGVPFEVAEALRDRRITATIRARTPDGAATVVCMTVRARCEPAGEGWRISPRR